MKQTLKNLVKRLLGRYRPLFPWYDSPWLSEYMFFRKKLAKKSPKHLMKFDQAMEVFKTPSTFKVKQFEHFFDTSRLGEIKTLIKTLQDEQLEKHETEGFGRLVVHNHEYFNQLQKELTEFVSREVGEAVEPCYNFLSLYSEMGQCEVHMDAPQAKWTLDVCIDQSCVWPIYFSEIEPWPTDKKYRKHKLWQEKIKNQRSFKAYSMKPGDAVIFSGSSQWHYRDPIPGTSKNEYCHLVFFHFLPKGTKELVEPENWEKIFC